MLSLHHLHEQPINKLKTSDFSNHRHSNVIKQILKHLESTLSFLGLGGGECHNTSLLPLGSSFFASVEKNQSAWLCLLLLLSAHPVVYYGAEGRRQRHIWLLCFSLAGGFHGAPRAAPPDALRSRMLPAGCTFVTLCSGLVLKGNSVPFHPQPQNAP